MPLGRHFQSAAKTYAVPGRWAYRSMLAAALALLASTTAWTKPGDAHSNDDAQASADVRLAMSKPPSNNDGPGKGAGDRPTRSTKSTTQPAGPKKAVATSRPAAKRKASSRSDDNTAGLPWRPGRKPVQLWPPPEKREVGTEPARDGIVIGQWSYRSERSPTARDGVPWRLIVTPAGAEAMKWQMGGAHQPVVALHAARVGAGEVRNEKDIPVIEMPQTVWRQRMGADLQDVVGVHFHEYVSNDVARILYTIHKVPPDNLEGTSSDSVYDGKSGTRIEATLLAPVIWHLDQSIVVRVDNETTPQKEEQERQTAYRVGHELGHAGVSQEVLPIVIAGPQTWNPQYCEGRRSEVVYYWKRELIGRSWVGYRSGGGGKIATLRTTIAVVPPTRWSLLLPIPPQRVTRKHLEQFNDQIVLLGPQLNAADKAAQEKFHAHHGEYDAATGP